MRLRRSKQKRLQAASDNVWTEKNEEMMKAQNRPSLSTEICYFFVSVSSSESLSSAFTQISKAGPKQINTPIGIAAILMNLSIR